MSKFVAVALVVLSFSLGAAEESKELYLPADPLKGANHFTEKGCDKCHSIEGYGGTFGTDLAHSDLNGSLLDVVALMWNHSPQMNDMMSDLRVVPPKFTGTELAELASYVFFIAYFDVPGDIAKGRSVFSKKGCDNCHRVGGIGTRVGPSLSHLKKYVSPIFLAQEMWNHGPHIKSSMDELGVPWPEFDGPEISNLLAFLRDASPDTTSVRVFMRPGNPQIGEDLFRSKRCISCHRVLDVGTEVGPDLTKSTFHESVTSIAAVMWNHGPSIWSAMDDMGVKKPTLKSNEMADLCAFLYFLRFLEKDASDAKGELLFNQKGCQNCHHFGEASVEGSHSLSILDENVRKIDVASGMWNHAQEMSENMTQRKLDWPRLYTGELNDLIEYILSHNRRD